MRPTIAALLATFSLLMSERSLAEMPSNRGRTERSFMLLWPGQSPDDARLDLDAPLITDRPNFTDAASTVGRGVSQIEFGYTYSRSETDAGEATAHTYPEAALRYGIFADWIELRVKQSLVTEDVSGDSATSFANTYLGTKVGLLPQYGVLPRVSVQPQMTIPTGSGSSQSEQILPSLNVLLFWSLSEESYLTGSSQVNRSEINPSSDISTTWAQSAALGTQINARISGFIECYGIFYDSVPDARDAYFSDTGITYLYSKDTQFDIRFGTRLQDRFGEELFAGMGMSVRFL